MDILKFVNRQDNKYTDLFESVLRDEILNTDRQKVDNVEKSIVAAVNAKLEHAATHCQGLNLLSNFVCKIDKESLSKYFPYWTGKIIQILSNAHSDSQELISVCRTIAALFTTCKQIAELDKRISMYVIKQIIGIISEHYSKDKNEILLNLFVVLLYHYPQSCVRLQAFLNPIISSCIDDDKNNLVISGAKCYSLLVRAIERIFLNVSKNSYAVAHDNNSASCHIFYQINLCNNLHIIMNELFQDLITVNFELPYDLQNTEYMHIIQLSKISCTDILEYYMRTENRFTNICIYLSTLLKVGGKGGKKFVLPNVILQVICQGLSVTPINLNKGDNEGRKDLLLLILPKLHMALLNVLKALIISFQQELLSFALTIQRLIIQILEWTQQYSQESYKNIRVLAYNILSIWLQQTRSLSGFQLIADEFLPHIIKDISLTKENILVLTSKANKKITNKNLIDKNLKENENLNQYEAESSNFNRIDSILSLNVVLTVQSILSHANCFLKQSFYDRIKNTVVLLLYEQYINKNSITVHKVNAEYRLQLLRTLRILQTHAHSSTPSPTSYAIQIFGIAISQESESEIIEEATLGLAEIRHIVNPTAPSLMLPLSKLSNSSPSSKPSSPQLLPSIEDMHFLQIDINQDFNNECNASIGLNKRPRLDEENSYTRTSIGTVNSNENKTSENSALIDEDKEMITSCCNVSSSDNL
ncbi:PREDICTED: proline-, glutamic acid- and leucine-rich protein 1-like [Ceratosolen solmsi marchali]|uniref:Proline-, glutamic acid- and leucine-rich protein 1-like n=1 Tax=Ceratosolen solmsi marchali TaxID=326594 RepID=A0AAJ6YNR6_9HYME|nr:PREDICTED: proline-, glutamic acid- and leucine-rich protein 1-like [Ceratosolen solmsi marchali]